MPLHHGRRRAIPQGGGTPVFPEEGLIFTAPELISLEPRRAIGNASNDASLTEFTYSYLVNMTAGGTYGATAVSPNVMWNYPWSTNHGNGVNSGNCNIAYFAANGSAYEGWSGLDPITGADSSDNDAAALIAAGTAHVLCVVSPSKIAYYREGVLAHTYSNVLNLSSVNQTMSMHVGGYATDNNTNSFGTVSDIHMWDRVLTDEEIVAVKTIATT